MDEVDMSLSPAEKAFAIDHIAEAILSNFDCQTLLNCRFICHRWANVAATELRKTVALDFRHPSGRDICQGQGQLQGQREPCDLCTLKDLISLMEDATVFPCTTFGFYVSNPLLDRFLQVGGPHVRKLTLYGHIALEDFRRLLFVEAPNLEHFELSGGVDVKVKDKVTGGQVINDPSLEGPITRVVPKKLQNLKTIQFNENKKRKVCEIPQTLFQEILKNSPNLTSVELPTEFLYYLVQPENNLHLIRNLKVKISEKTVNSLETVFLKGDVSNGNSFKKFKYGAIRKLDLLDLQKLLYKPSLVARGVKVLSTILNFAATTCQELLWSQMPFLKAEALPRMSNVTHLALMYSYTYHKNPSRQIPGYSNSTQFFPREVILEEMFPKLETLTFKTKGQLTCDVSYFIETTDLFHVQEGLPHEGVKRIYWIGNMPQNESFREGFREIFPNAIFSIFENPGSC